MCYHAARTKLLSSLVGRRGVLSFPFQVRGWKKEIEDEEKRCRAQRLAGEIKRREERVEQSVKRGER